MKRRAIRLAISVGLTVCLLSAAGGWAQEPGGTPAKGESPPIAAIVNGEPVYVATLQGKYGEIAKRRGLGSQNAPRARAELLTQLINRELVIQMLQRDNTLVKPEEIDRQQQQTAEQIKKQYGVSLEQYTQKSGLTLEAIRKELFWQLAWDRYLERNLADALEGYFDQHKKDLDGTEVRASHILLRPEKYNETTEQIVARANKIRQEIQSGRITFEDAATKYSVGPSRAKGGDLGFIPRTGVMLADFTTEAFKLQQGEISEPLTTSFGTHLIRVTEIKPGKRQWTEVIPQIKTLASGDLFEKLADKEMPSAKIQFTGTVPYIKPGTDEMVAPATAGQAATK